MAGSRRVSWRAVAAGGVVALWALLCVARLLRLAEPADAPVGSVGADFVAFAAAAMPPDARYLYVEPVDFGEEDGTTPRLRYELYPRGFENRSWRESEDAIHQFLAREQRRYVVVPSASAYPANHWLRGDRAWFQRLRLDADRSILVVRDGP